MCCVAQIGKQGLPRHGVLMLVPRYKGKESDAKAAGVHRGKCKTLFLGSFLASGLEGLLRNGGQRSGEAYWKQVSEKLSPEGSCSPGQVDMRLQQAVCSVRPSVGILIL